MKVYVVEYVTYDYYRFDEVIGVSLSPAKAKKKAEKYRNINGWIGKVEIFTPDDIYFREEFDRNEMAHLLIREFEAGDDI